MGQNLEEITEGITIRYKGATITDDRDPDDRSLNLSGDRMLVDLSKWMNEVGLSRMNYYFHGSDGVFEGGHLEVTPANEGSAMPFALYRSLHPKLGELADPSEEISMLVEKTIQVIDHNACWNDVGSYGRLEIVAGAKPFCEMEINVMSSVIEPVNYRGCGKELESWLGRENLALIEQWFQKSGKTFLEINHGLVGIGTDERLRIDPPMGGKKMDIPDSMAKAIECALRRCPAFQDCHQLMAGNWRFSLEKGEVEISMHATQQVIDTDRFEFTLGNFDLAPQQRPKMKVQAPSDMGITI